MAYRILSISIIILSIFVISDVIVREPKELRDKFTGFL